MRWPRLLMVSAAAVMSIAGVSGQVTSTRAAVPADPIPAVVAAFRSHSVVTVSDPHGNEQVQAFIKSLVRDSRVREVMDDVVLETASARYQDAIDRYVRGEDVPRASLRKAWEDHTVANSFGAQADDLIETMRAVNVTSPGRKLRLIAGDPPIDWEQITSTEDHQRWIAQRDSYPADLIRRQVLDRGRRALVVYGQAHLQRRQVASNYDMSAWQAQTVVSLLEHDSGVPVFNLWTWLDREVELTEAASWPAPSLAVLKNTTLGTRDFGTYAGGLLGGNRFAVKDGRIVPLPREQWRQMRMDEEFDALLYLGAPAAMTFVGPPRGACRDPQFVSERIRRLTLAGPPPELASFKSLCAV